jgi:hypothetical protein
MENLNTMQTMFSFVDSDGQLQLMDPQIAARTLDNLDYEDDQDYKDLNKELKDSSSGVRFGKAKESGSDAVDIDEDTPIVGETVTTHRNYVTQFDPEVDTIPFNPSFQPGVQDDSMER